MQVRLEVAHRNANHKKVVLKADTLIGRSADCNLRIASKEVSRKHCHVTVAETGVMVRDLGSANGTFVNGYKLDRDVDYAVEPDSELSVGGIKFVVRYEAPAAPPDPKQPTPGSTVDLKEGADAPQGPVAAVVADAALDAEPTETIFDQSSLVAEEPPAEETEFEPLAEAEDVPAEPAADAPDTVFEDDPAAVEGELASFQDETAGDPDLPETVFEVETDSPLADPAEFAELEDLADPGHVVGEAPTDTDLTKDDLSDSGPVDESFVASEIATEDTPDEPPLTDEPLAGQDDEEFAFANLATEDTQDFPAISVDDSEQADEDDGLDDFLKGFGE